MSERRRLPQILFVHLVPLCGYRFFEALFRWENHEMDFCVIRVIRGQPIGGFLFGCGLPR